MEQTTTAARQVIIKSVSLYPDDWALAQNVAAENGQRSISAGLRAIIAFYRRYHKDQPPAPLAGT